MEDVGSAQPDADRSVEVRSEGQCSTALRRSFTTQPRPTTDQRRPVRKKPDTEALLERLRAFRGRLPADFRFNRDDANARS